MQWIPFPDDRLSVFGLPFLAANENELLRLPQSRQTDYREGVWGLAHSPAGGRIRFRTNSGTLALRLDYGSVGHMNNMCRIGQHSVDCYVDGTFWRNAAPLEGEAEIEATFFTGVEPAWRQVDLYLPLYHSVKVLGIGFGDEADIGPPTPFATDRPVVFYGSSITQGGCASRAGNSYQGMLCRRLNLDHVNLGFSGSGRGEPALAETVASIPAACYVIDYAQNCPTIEELAETYPPFLATIRERNPSTPILCVTPIGAASEVWDKDHHARLEQMREVIRAAVKARQDDGDPAIRMVEGWDVLGPSQMDGIVDMSHPNDLGFWCMANGLEPRLRDILGL